MSKFILVQDNKCIAITNSKNYELAKKKFIKYCIKNPSEVHLSLHLFNFQVSQTCYDQNGSVTEGITEYFDGNIKMYEYWKEKSLPKNLQKIDNKKIKEFFTAKAFDSTLEEDAAHNGINIINVNDEIKI